MSNSPEEYAIHEMVRLTARLVEHQANNISFLNDLEQIKITCEKTRRQMSFRVEDLEDDTE
jgi:hypothetical protein